MERKSRNRYVRGIALLVFFLLQSALFAQQSFVKREGNHFTVNSRPYYFMGTNYWYSVPLALEGKKGEERIKKELDFLQKQGITNLRILAGAEGVGLMNGVERLGPPLQPRQHVFNDSVLHALDFVLSEMGRRHIYAVIYLSNNWEWSGGFLQYLNWNGRLSDQDMRKKMSWDEQRAQTAKFYSCRPCREDYKTQVAYIIGHYNERTKKHYYEDPTIMAWELGNEPRPMEKSAVPDFENWVSEAAAFIRSRDAQHLITTGIEGEIGTADSIAVYENVNADKNIDYLTLHIWPKNWGWFTDTSIAVAMPAILTNTLAFIEKHMAVADKLNKPLVLEEFGLPRDKQSFDPATSTHSRDRYYESIFHIWNENRKNKGSLAGCNFWTYGGLGKPVKGQLYWKAGDDFTGDPPQEEQGLNSVFNTDETTWKIIRSFRDLK